jgi:putative heme-binding domain-containing protein
VKLVQTFQLDDQSAGLLEVVLRQPASDAATDAVKLLVKARDTAILRSGLDHSNTTAAIKIAQVLGGSGKDAQLLLPLIKDSRRHLALRQQAVRSIVQTRDGAETILALAQAGLFPEELRFTASSELNRVRWPEIRTQAAEILPLPQARDSEPLPPLPELASRKGDPANGAIVFKGAAAGCTTCHRVKGEGTDFGPDLSEIGTKMGKEALYQAILDPSAGISFGYEAWQVRLSSGEEVYGLLASETPNEIAIKVLGGIVSRYGKNEIAERQKMQLSIMPAGLQHGLSSQELVDLVEFLSSLKKW